MHALTDPLEEIRPVVTARLRDLETALVAHGFMVETEAKFWQLIARHRADRIGPARTVRVQLSADHAGRLHWYWLRAGVEDWERLEPADAIAATTERLARMLSAGQP